jgi:hypothetical protein
MHVIIVFLGNTFSVAVPSTILGYLDISDHMSRH